MGAVGPTQVLVDVNGHLRVFDKSGNQNPGDLDVSDSTFWAPELPTGVEPTDPGVEYDRLSGRWIVSAISVQNNNNLRHGGCQRQLDDHRRDRFHLLLLPGECPVRRVRRTSRTTHSSRSTRTRSTSASTSSARCSGSFTGTSLYVIRKSSAIGGGPLLVHGLPNRRQRPRLGPGQPPARHEHGPGRRHGLRRRPGQPDRSTGWTCVKVNNPGGTSPTISRARRSPCPATAQPLSVPAQGAAGGIDALDDRFFEAMVAEGPDGDRLALDRAQHPRQLERGRARRRRPGRARGGTRWAT